MRVVTLPLEEALSANTPCKPTFLCTLAELQFLKSVASPRVCRTNPEANARHRDWHTLTMPEQYQNGLIQSLIAGQILPGLQI
jgi:hypothetical protein